MGLIMSYSREEAATSLQAVDAMEQRAKTLRGYEQGAPYFFLWGIIWIVGYSASDVYPQWAGAVWLGLNVLGTFSGLVIGERMQINKSYRSRYLVVVMSAFAFAGATYFVLRPTSAQQLNAFPALLVSFVYILMGIQRGARLVIAGIALATLTLLGFTLMREHFALWMAAVGGGTLFITGFWMRRI